MEQAVQQFLAGGALEVTRCPCSMYMSRPWRFGWCACPSVICTCSRESGGRGRGVRAQHAFFHTFTPFFLCREDRPLTVR